MLGEKPHQPGEEGHNQDPAGSPGLWRHLELRLQTGEGTGQFWPRLEERLATAGTHPRLREGLVLKPFPPKDDPAYLLGDPTERRYFRLGEREAFILSLLDGQHETQEIVRDCSARFGPIPMQSLDQFLRNLRLAGLLEESGGLWRRLASSRKSGPLVLWALPDAEAQLVALQRRLRFLFHPLAWVAVLVLLLGALLLLILRWELLRSDWAYLSSAWWLIPLLLVTLYAAMVVVVLTHELAHALACIHAGGRVSRLGLMVRHLLPAAFADVSDVWFLPKGARVTVFLAGPASTIFWAALVTGIWAWTPAGSFAHLLGATIMLASFISIVFGLNPVGGYDGSEVLSEWLEVPDLHRRALRYTWERLRGRSTPNASPRERRVFLLYSLTFFLYNVAIVTLIALFVWRMLFH